jgi:hypothetical protein
LKWWFQERGWGGDEEIGNRRITKVPKERKDETEKSLGIPGFEWQTCGNFRMFLARRDVYGFLFSARRVFIIHSPRHFHAAFPAFDQHICHSHVNGEEEPVTNKRSRNFVRPLKATHPFFGSAV